MKRGRPRAAGSDAGSGAAEPLGALLVDSLGAPVGKHRVPRDRRPTKPQKDLVPPFWSERKYGVARGQWEPRKALKGGDVKPSRIIEIEGLIREAAEGARPPKTTPRDFVFKLLSARDQGGAPNYGKTAIAGVMEPFERTGLITTTNFIKQMRRKLGVGLDVQEAVGIFKLYGHDEKGRMPYEIFCNRLFGGDSKALAKQGSRDGAFIWDRPEGWDWDGMIRYPHCKNGVYPPSDWPLMAESCCRLSKEKPDTYLKIEHVFGYTVQSSPNLYYNRNGDVVYFAAGAGVVYDDDGGGDDSKKNRQKFFLRHDNDIECLAMHPDRDTVASGQFGVEPTVWIWSSETRSGPQGVSESPIELTCPRGERSVIACSFSPDGERLATVSTDGQHTVRVWDWKAQAPVDGMVTNGYKGEPPAVFGVLWNPYKGDPDYPDALDVDFMTYGIKHVSFWTIGHSELEKTGVSFGDFTIQDVLHACFLPSGHVLAGGPNGSITVIAPSDDGPTAIDEIQGAHEDMGHLNTKVTDPDYPHMVIAVRHDTVLANYNAATAWEISLLSGGVGGVIKEWTWDQSSTLSLKKEYDIRNLGADKVPEVVSIDIDPQDDQKFVAGTAGNDVWEVDEDPRVMVEGQSADVYGLAAYPQENVFGDETLGGRIYASGSEDGNVYIWDAQTRENLHSFEVRRFDDHKDEEDDPEIRSGDGYPRNEQLKVRAVDWSHNGDRLVLTTCGVVGRDEDDDLGGVIQIYAVNLDWFQDDEHILDYDAATFLERYRVWESKDCNAMIDDCKFSPDGQSLAAGCHDSNIYLYRLDVEPLPGGDAAKPTFPTALEVAEETKARLDDIEKTVNAALGESGTLDRSEDMDEESRRATAKALKEARRNMMKDAPESVRHELKEQGDNPAKLTEPARKLKERLGKVDAFSSQLYSRYFRKAGACVGHSSYVSHLEWSADSNVLQSTSGDFELLYWDVRGKIDRRAGIHGGKIAQLGPARIAELRCKVRDMEWASWTCLQGFPVMGMWQDGQCGNDINSCHRSPDGHSLVTSDDDGFVRLFNYPCVIKEAPHHAFKGHAAFTENVRFLADGKRVVSAGGGDRCLIQWRVRRVPGAGAAQGRLRKSLSDNKELYKLQLDRDYNTARMLEADREIVELKQRLALKGTSGNALALRRSMSQGSTSAGPAEGLDLRRVQAEFARMAKREGGGRGKLKFPAFQMLMNRLGCESRNTCSRCCLSSCSRLGFFVPPPHSLGSAVVESGTGAAWHLLSRLLQL